MRRPVDLVTIAGVHIADRRGVTPARGECRDSPRAEQQAGRTAERCERSGLLGRLPRRERSLDRGAESRDIGSLPRRYGRFSRS